MNKRALSIVTVTCILVSLFMVAAFALPNSVGGENEYGEAVIGEPTNLRWERSEGKVFVVWDAPLNATAADSYELNINNKSIGWGINKKNIKTTRVEVDFGDFKGDIPGQPTDNTGEYTFDVRAISGDISQKESSDVIVECATNYKYPSGDIVRADGTETPDTVPETEPDTQPDTQPEDKTKIIAAKTTSTVVFDGVPKIFDAYLINENNYFKLRDLAFIFNHTDKQFEVKWDTEKNAINVFKGKEYTAQGNEMMMEGETQTLVAIPNTSKIYIDGQEIALSAYTINENNYIKLRDIGKAMDFFVDWAGEQNKIVLKSTEGYTQ